MLSNYGQFLQWSINNPTLFTVLVIVSQLLLSIMLAEMLSRFLFKRDVGLVHGYGAQS